MKGSGIHDDTLQSNNLATDLSLGSGPSQYHASYVETLSRVVDVHSTISKVISGFIVALSLAMNSTDAATAKSAQNSSASLWDHNGSILYLVANGQKREFFYQEPRKGMLQAGAREGSLLFSGVSKGNQYSGTAFIYKPQCGTFPYRVSGPILDNYRRVILRGQAPRVDANCKIVGHFADTLEFVHRSSASKESDSPPIPPPGASSRGCQLFPDLC